MVHLSTAYGVVKNVLAHVAEAHSGHVVEVPVEFRGHSSFPCGAGGVPLEQAVARAIDDAQASGSEVRGWWPLGWVTAKRTARLGL